jgi:uncharacterized protein (DUF305 family)
MNSRTVLIVLGTLIVGIVLGYVIAPKMPGHMGMMGAQQGMGMQQNIDAHFIEQMIPHHEGAIDMAKVALERSQRAEVRSLANDIISAQTEEISQMQRWYQDWFGKAPAASGGHGMHMNGMSGDTGSLRTTSDFDREFVTQMITHHEMAVMMAQMLQSSTDRPEMKQLASNIISSQTKEIEMMRGWLKEWGNQ